jgi:hypothetical protein
MVRTAIGQWVQNHKVDDLKSIRVCDPACGSGAFLVAAYDYLVEAHIRRYLRRQDTIDRYLVDQGLGVYSLVIPEKKRILKDCIFGIDIDPAAVEITKLSLLLAVLEGETRESVDRQLSLFHERPLPDLSTNILCNNSLLESSDLGLTDLGYIEQLKPLDWDTNPITGGGFDVLIGNPPYVFGEWHHPVQLRVIRSRLAPIRQVDLYHAFLDLVMRKRRPDGYWSLIVPDAVLARDDTQHLRSRMLEQGDLQASHVGCVFADAAVSCVVLTQGPLGHRRIEVHGDPEPDGSHSVERSISYDAIRCIPDMGFRLSLDEKSLRLLGRLRARPRTISDALVALSRGEEFGKKDLGIAGPDMEPCIVGEDIDLFRIRDPKLCIPSHSVAKDRAKYSAPKVVTVKTGLRPKSAIDRLGLTTLQSVYNLHPKPPATVEVIAAVLNSSLASWFIRAMYTSHKKLFPQMNQRHLLEVPLPDANESDIVETVRALEASENEAQRAFLIRKIDGLVSSGYGLTADEKLLILR